MTVTSETYKNTYSCNGSQTVFPYTFKVFEDDELEVILYTIADGTETILTLTSNYTVSGAGDARGGNVTTVSTYSSAYKLVIRRNLALKQEIDPVESDPNRAATTEEAYDRAVMRDQQLQEQLDRVVLQNATATASITYPLPVANNLIGWDSAGTNLENKVVSDFSAAEKASQAEAEAGTDNDKYTTPLRVAQAITALGQSLDLASQAEAEAGTENTKYMSALRVAQAISALTTTINFEVAATTYDASTTGTLEVTLSGSFTPKIAIVFTSQTAQFSVGVYDGTIDEGIYYSALDSSSGNTTYVGEIRQSSPNIAYLAGSSFSSGKVSLTKSKVSGPTGTIKVVVLAIG